MKLMLFSVMAALAFVSSPSFAAEEAVALEGTDKLTVPLGEDALKLEEFLKENEDRDGWAPWQYWHCAAFPNHDPHHSHAHHAYGYNYHDTYYRALYDCEHYHHFCHVHCHVHHR